MIIISAIVSGLILALALFICLASVAQAEKVHESRRLWLEQEYTQVHKAVARIAFVLEQWEVREAERCGLADQVKEVRQPVFVSGAITAPVRTQSPDSEQLTFHNAPSAEEQDAPERRPGSHS